MMQILAFFLSIVGIAALDATITASSSYPRVVVTNFVPKVFSFNTEIGIVVSGRNFPTNGAVQCRFMDKTDRPVYQRKITTSHVKSSQHIYCDTPKLSGAERPLDLFLDITYEQQSGQKIADQESVFVGELFLRPQSFDISRTSAHIPLDRHYVTPPITISSNIEMFSPVATDMYRCRWRLQSGSFLDVDAALTNSNSPTKNSQ